MIESYDNITKNLWNVGSSNSLHYSTSLFLLQGYLVPKGYSVMYCITDTHEQSPLFAEKDRLQFDPDRWSKLCESCGVKEHNQFGDDAEDSDEPDMNGNQVPSALKSKAVIDHPELHHYIPFGSGTRRCIGQQFAKVFINVLIIELCCSTTWEMLNPNPKIKSAPLPFPADGMPLRFHQQVEE